MEEEDRPQFQLAVSFKKMKAKLYLEEELIKTFELNKKDVGILVDYFMWRHEGDSSDTKHHVIIEMGKPVKGVPRKPSMQIYPIAGIKVLCKEPITAFWVEGTYEDYLSNHKHYEENE